MKWFGRKTGEADTSASGGQQAVEELLDRYHSRASISDGSELLVEPSQVLENIALAMERVDTDINTPISIEEDVASFAELASLTQYLQMGPTLAVHVVNTAMRIMSARYPEELVRLPLPPEYDLRQLAPLAMDDQFHEIAKTIFNLRTVHTGDVSETDVAAELEALDADGQMQVFVALFYMYGTKVGALKFNTGIE